MMSPPTLRPGSRIRSDGKGSGTLGPLAVTKEGEVMYVVTQHQLEGSKGPMYLEPEMIPVSNYDSKTRGFDCSLKMKDVFDDLPSVLKSAIEPEIGRNIFKVGMQTGLTRGRVKSVSAKPSVDMKNGSIVQMQDMIETDAYSADGDSGSFGLTFSTLEPMGLLSCGDPNRKRSYFVSLKKMQDWHSLQGFYAPLSLPQNTPKGVKLAISSFLPDGIFLQKKSLVDKDIQTLMDEIGIKRVVSHESKSGITYTVTYDGMMTLAMPFNPYETGGLLQTEDHKLVGLIVAGSKDMTTAIGICPVLKALELELLKIKPESYGTLLRASYWRTRCQNPECAVIIPPIATTCPFCGATQDLEVWHNQYQQNDF